MRLAHFFGKRTIKTALAIGLGMLLYIALKSLDVIIKIDGTSLYKRDSGFRFSDFYSPFFAGIAAAYSLYPSKKESISQAKNRVVASFLGGVIGIILTISYGLLGVIFDSDFFEWPNLGDTYSLSQYIIPYILIFIFIMVVIAVGNLINKKSAIFVGILTFISVTINPMGMIVSRYDDTAMFLGEAVFGINRILSTIVGVFIALAVNSFRLPHKVKNKDILFVVGMEEAIKDDTMEFEGFFKYKLKDFTYRNIPLSLYTTYTPMTFMTLLKDVDLTSPVICMSGAALYDSVKDDYVYTCPLRDEDSRALAVELASMGIVPFKNTIVDDTLFITTYDLNYKYNKLYYEARLDMPFCNVYHKDLFDENILYYLIIDELDELLKIKEKLDSRYYCVITEILDSFNKDHKLFYLKIYNKNVEMMYGIAEYAARCGYRIASLTSDKVANHLLDVSDIKATFEMNVDKYDGKIDLAIKNNSYSTLFKSIDKIYYSKEYKK